MSDEPSPFLRRGMIHVDMPDGTVSMPAAFAEPPRHADGTHVTRIEVSDDSRERGTMQFAWSPVPVRMDAPSAELARAMGVRWSMPWERPDLNPMPAITVSPLLARAQALAATVPAVVYRLRRSLAERIDPDSEEWG